MIDYLCTKNAIRAKLKIIQKCPLSLLAVQVGPQEKAPTKFFVGAFLVMINVSVIL